MAITEERWQATRAAVVAAGSRFADLVAASDPRVMATADWTVADTAAHVASIAFQYTHIVRMAEPVMPAIQEQVLATTVDTVADLNAQTMGLFTERDPATLNERLRADIADLLRATDEVDPAAPVTWLGDSKVPVCGVLAHLVNELLIHGWDIARATHRPWPMPPADAALFFEAFFVEVIRNGIGHLLDSDMDADEPARDRRIAVGFRSRYTTPVTIVLRNGQVSLAEPGDDTDVRIYFDPPAFNLMMFHRISKARAALTGKVLVWGRRPWLLPAFLRKVRCP